MSYDRRKVALTLVTGVGLAGCATGPTMVQDPVVGVESVTHDELLELPPPRQKIAVAVYAFEDETGQFEFSDTVQTLSRAVTQGATSILIEALLQAGNGAWFTVVEREGIDNLLRERQIIRETRAIYEGGGDLSRNYLPPLLFAGMMLEGGIIGYDTNTLTGGLGARLLGIGGSTKFRQDTVTVYLRAISTQSGEVLESINVSKTIFSVALSADVFRFISSDEILEIDTGVTTNEPEHLAVKQAIEKAVIALVVEGARDERWAFVDPAAAAALLAEAPGRPGTQQAEATAEADRPQSTPAPSGGDRAERSGALRSPAAAVAPAAPPARMTRVADARTPEPTEPEPQGSRTTGHAPARTAGPSIDEAMAQQALGILITERAGDRPSAASSPAQQGSGSWLRKVGEPEIIPLPREPGAEARRPARPAAPSRPVPVRTDAAPPAAPESKSPGRRPGKNDVVTPSRALLAGLGADDLDPHPEPRMEEP